MKVSVEVTGTLERKLKIYIPAEKVKSEQQKRIHEASTTASIKGFRPGKAPRHFIERRFGKQIQQEVMSKLIEESLPSAFEQEKLSPASTPNVESIEDKDILNEGLKFEVRFDIFPEIKLKDFSEINLTKPTAEITAEDVAEGCKRLQDQFATFTLLSDENNRAVKDGDQLDISFTGFVDGKPFEGGSAENVSIVVGQERFIPGFEEGLIGLSAGDSKSLDLTFPKEYGEQKLAGKAVRFDLTVNSIKEKKLAPLDEEYARQIGISDGDVSKIDDKIKSNMQEFLENIIKNQLREQALHELATLHPIDVPKQIFEQEKQHLIERAERNASGEFKLEGELLKNLEAGALRNARLGLLIKEVVTLKKVKPDAEQVKSKIQEIAAAAGANAEFIQKLYYESKELLQGVQNMVLADKVADIIIAEATIKERKSTFYKIANGTDSDTSGSSDASDTADTTDTTDQ